MFRHISIVHQPSVITLGLGSVIQIGDTNQMELKNRTIAVHRETPYFLSTEGKWETYEIFVDDEITIPTRVNEVNMTVINKNPFIEVNCITIQSMLNASCLHIGSIDYVFLNSRILQIRQFTTKEPFRK
ncbi:MULTISPECIES: spore germination protein GerPE [unclassified Bacillus (in: firmicutes)]|uniref:spore germination protein GerPE n=1 Tax=unclassified Bacillus (in: firmicutes) TaxID=185979 RepID=UPI0008E73B35|nr:MULTISPECIES: spore germination protein GerPE [unclassified Bacillus (in: firmicutes)]SFJ06691.1 spore germination protein PE [Bacillus sp. 71mf]SFS67878.1 spore germination protein PE [Bacillus sp. 103mf]